MLRRVRPALRRAVLGGLAVVALVGASALGGGAGVGGSGAAVAAPMWPVPAPYPVPSDPPESLAAIPPGSEYVALGDSYSAGYGLDDPTHLPTDACAQSARDYPHRIAARFGLALTDVTCAGATSDDVVSGFQFRGVPPQVRALSDRTRLVTITIGGNDADLFGTAASCLALSSKGPVFSGRDAPSCRSTLVRDGEDQLGVKIRSRVALSIAETLGAVRAAAPNAVVVFLGYPAIFPDAEHTPRGGCFRSALDLGSLAGSFPSDTFPFTDTDVRYLHGVQEELDTASADAARAAGVRFVDVFAASQAHSACATKGSYVAGVSLEGSGNLSRIDLVPGALHPNERGVAWLTGRVAAAVRDLAG
ncbi:GDSL-like lipase/acylhydrolase family protein [Curtobacterium sp. AG1037]|uniref:SGNH/GDSL hydrolase family protein n=1 Tax=Curtobacterium sp. AG1037 TaxID=2183990 RepID=UPI000E0A8585|nr:SGNH/GDSL hydrolase family protein [Curtobacterium sp. AG1037]RDH95783.1 GDSL-like lipase/acylhydrolase family protein [Curtobacterium sp. AG1037]